MYRLKCVTSLICLLILVAPLCAEPPRTKIVADMEGKTTFGVSGQTDKPKASLTTRTASQGKRSLRFEYDGKGRDRATVTFVVDGAEGFNAIAFDLYCERNNGSSLIVSVRQQTEGKGKAARYKSVLRLDEFVDGWAPVRLVKDAGMVFKQNGGVLPDWSKIRTVSLSLSGVMEGKAAIYLDNIRFEDVAGGGPSSNRCPRWESA